jgi:hypothetical protein
VTEVYGDNVVRVQHVSKWCQEFENISVIICNDDRTSHSSKSRTDVNAATNGGTNFGKPLSHHMSSLISQ